MDTAPLRVGLVGCGNISSIYLENCRQFPNLAVLACADLELDRARSQAAAFAVPRVCTVDELLADPEIEAVLNLTVPLSHAEISLAALEAGKHVYSEKPLATNRADGRRILESAEERGLLVGCAPDTFLGGGTQTCRGLIDGGAIGQTVACSAFWMSPGHESWHPNPTFYYQRGGGPMLDMGPYYLTALVSLLGPVRRVTGIARAPFSERIITSQPQYGKRIPVEVPTHVAGVMELDTGAVGSIITSFDVWPYTLPPLEIYGSEGTMLAPDPNAFKGPVKVRRRGEEAWADQPLTHGYTENVRGLGLADLAIAVRMGRPPRASGRLAYHVLDVMQSFLDASSEGRQIEIESTCERPAPLPAGISTWSLEL
jgi:predicted dehydrogenase